MAKIGLKMRIKAVSWPAFLAESARKNTVVLGTTVGALDYPDPSDFEPMFATKSIADEESKIVRFSRTKSLMNLGRKGEA